MSGSSFPLPGLLQGREELLAAAGPPLVQPLALLSAAAATLAVPAQSPRLKNAIKNKHRQESLSPKKRKKGAAAAKAPGVSAPSKSPTTHASKKGRQRGANWTLAESKRLIRVLVRCLGCFFAVPWRRRE